MRVLRLIWLGCTSVVMSIGSYAGKTVATAVVATDGSGDFTDIQTAIDSLSSGGVVYIKEGTYTITTRINVNTEGISIVGAGFTSKIIGSGAIGIRIDAANCTLEKLNVSTSGAGTNDAILLTSNATDCHIFNCWVHDATSSGIDDSGDPSGIIIDGCIIYNNNVSGVSIAASDLTIVNNIIYSNTGSGASLGNTGGSVHTRLMICNNFFKDNTQDGIRLNDVTNSVIDGNILTGNNDNGIRLNADIDKCIVSNNICTGNDVGILINNANCDRNIVTSNQIHTNTSAQFTDNGTNTVSANNQTV